MKQKVLAALSAILMVLASVVASSASWWVLYQPKVPKVLRK